MYRSMRDIYSEFFYNRSYSACMVDRDECVSPSVSGAQWLGELGTFSSESRTHRNIIR